MAKQAQVDRRRVVVLSTVVVLFVVLAGAGVWYYIGQLKTTGDGYTSSKTPSVQEQQQARINQLKQEVQKTNQPEAKKQLAQAYSDAKQYNDAVATYNDIGIDLGPTATPYDYLDMTSAYAKAGNIEKAKQAIDKATEVANALTDPVAHDEALNDIRFYRKELKL